MQGEGTSGRSAFFHSHEEDATALFEDAKRRLKDVPNVYQEIMAGLQRYKEHRMRPADFADLLSHSLRGHDDLKERFNAYLPKPFKRQKRYEPELGIDQRISSMKGCLGGKSQQDIFEKAVKFVHSVQEQYKENPGVGKIFCEAIGAYARKRTSLQVLLEQVAILFSNKPIILKNFQYFLEDQPEGIKILEKCRQRNLDHSPPHASAVSESDYREDGGITSDEDARRIVYQEMGFLRRLKGSLRSPKTYFSFLKLLNLYNHDVINREQLENMAEALLSQWGGAMDDFQKFLKRCESRSYGDLSDRDHPLNKLKIAKAKKRDYDRKPIQELDTSNMERCTPSYLMLPPDYPKLKCSGMTKISEEVLNDIMVSLPTGSEEFSSKHLQKNVYEEQLFRFEDRLTEIDVSISRCKVTMSAARKLLSDLEAAAESRKSKRISPEKYFSEIHMRVIKNLFGTRFDKIFSLFYEQPLNAIRVVISRLNQKLEDWSSARRDVLSGSQKYFQENYLKSLDHQSNNFKQREKKQLSMKVLLSEILTASEREINPYIQLAHLCGYVPWKQIVGSSPHLSYKMSDRAVWERMMEHVIIHIQFSSPLQDCAASLQFWRDFVVPFIDISSLDNTRSSPRHISGIDAGAGSSSQRDSEDGEDSETNGEKEFGGCEPVMIETNQESKRLNLSLLFCDKQFYRFFRLLQILYDRFAAAEYLCNEAARKSGLKDSTPIETQFFALLKTFMRVDCLSDEFEDECRKLLGCDSYVLFTIDQLLGRTCRQIRQLAFSDTIDLYYYQQKQRCVHEEGYFANARVVLRTDHIFRIEMTGSEKDGGRLLNIHSIRCGTDLSDFQGIERRKGDVGSVEVISSMHGRGGRVLLARNLGLGRRMMIDGSKQEESVCIRKAEEELKEKRLQMTYILHGLEWKVEGQGGKMLYLPGTEDVQYFKGRQSNCLRQSTLRLNRQQKFSTWVKQKIVV